MTTAPVLQKRSLRYLLKRVEAIRGQPAYPSAAPATNSSSPSPSKRRTIKVTALNITKRRLDYNQHAPAIFFPLLVPECLLIEPTGTEPRKPWSRHPMFIRKKRWSRHRPNGFHSII